MDSLSFYEKAIHEQELRFRIFRALYEQNGDVSNALEKLNSVHNAIKGVSMVVENGVVKQTVAKALNKDKRPDA